MPIVFIIKAVKRLKSRLREEGDPEHIGLLYLILRKAKRVVFCDKKKQEQEDEEGRDDGEKPGQDSQDSLRKEQIAS